MKKQVIHLFYCTTAALLITIVPAQCMERKNIYDAIVEQLRIDIKKKTIEVESLSKKLSKVYEHFIDKVYLKKASYKMLAAKLAEKTGSRTWFSIADVKDAAVEDLDEDIDDFLKNFTIKDITFNPKTGAPEWTKEKGDEYNILVNSIKNHPALRTYEEAKNALFKHLGIWMDTKIHNLNNELKERARSAAKEQQKAIEPKIELTTSWRNWKNLGDLPKDKQTLLAEWQDFLKNLVYSDFTSRDPNKEPYKDPNAAMLIKEKGNIMDLFRAALCDAWNHIMSAEEFDTAYQKRKAEIMH